MKVNFLSPQIHVQKWIVYLLAFILLDTLFGRLYSFTGFPKSGHFVDFFSIPILFAYYLIPSVGPFFIIPLTVIDLYAFLKGDTQERKTLAFFLLVLFFYDTYLIWWYGTNQKCAAFICF